MGFIKTCTDLASRAGLRGTDASEQKKALESRIDVLSERLGAADPFGVSALGPEKYSDRLEKAFREHGISWSDLNQLEDKLRKGNFLQRQLARQTYMRLLARAHSVALLDTGDVKSMAIERMNLRRLLQMMDSVSGSGQSVTGTEKADKTSAGDSKGSPQPKREKGSPNDKSSEDGKEEKANGQSTGSQDGQSEAGERSGKKQNRSAEGDSSPNRYSNFKEASEALLRHLYVWELSKYHSGAALRAGLQNYFDFLGTTGFQFESHVMNHFRRLTEYQIDRLSAEDFSHDSIDSFVEQVRSAGLNGDIQVLYSKALGLYRTLRELQRYHPLDATEAKVFSALDALLESLRSGSDSSTQPVTERFFRQLVGDLSRGEMRDRFGPNLLEAGSQAQERFYNAIANGELWLYRYMGLLRPYLNVRERKLFMFAPRVNPYGPIAPHATGPTEFALTDDPKHVDRFVDMESAQLTMLRLSEGNQRYRAQRTERPSPGLSRKAYRKVSFLIGDVSGSMDKRAHARNAIFAAYIDFYLSELATSQDISAGQGGETVGSHVIHHASFNSELGQISTIRTKNQGAEFVKSIAHRPEENVGGDTRIGVALLQALDKIHQSKIENNGDLQSATVLLVTDGEDDTIDLAAIEAKLDLIGRDTKVIINVVLTGQENDKLRALARYRSAARSEQDSLSEFNYKFLSQEKLDELLTLSKQKPSLEPSELRRLIPLVGFQSGGVEIRGKVEAVIQAANLLRPGSRGERVGLDRTQRHLAEVFRTSLIPSQGLSARILKSTARIARRLEEVLGYFRVSGIATDARASFLDRMIEDLCREENLLRGNFEEGLRGLEHVELRSKVRDWLGIKE